jgi:hypothetical protein
VRYTGFVIAAAVSVLAVTLPNSPGAFGERIPAGRAGDQQSAIVIPPSLQAEHEEIHTALAAATRAPGQVGGAAKALAALLDPHFERENQIALPPLGLLAALAAGGSPDGAQDALAMTDALRKELPRMLEEHKRIRAATEQLRTAASKEKATMHEEFAMRLAAHARTEEEVLYPAAILVGEIIRARMGRK